MRFSRATGTPNAVRVLTLTVGQASLASAAAAALARGTPHESNAPAYPGARVPGRRDWEQAQPRRRR